MEKNLTNNVKAFIKLNDLLTIDEKIILSQRFIKGRTLKQVAQAFKMTSSAIKLKEDNAIAKIDRVFDYIDI